MKRSSTSSKQRIVIKIGTSVLAGAQDAVDTKMVGQVVSAIAKLLERGRQIVVVSSGAIASGMNLIRQQTRPTQLSRLQALAAIGQVQLMDYYKDHFKRYDRLCAQVLLTWDDFNSRQRYLNSKNTLECLIEMGAIPIVNENDTVSTDEIKFGDNDRLSVLVAQLIDADRLVILSDVDGLYDHDKNRIPCVERITEKLQELVCQTKRDVCVGGMSAKLTALKAATDAGITCVIANGKSPDSLVDIDDGKDIGTLFLAGSARLKAKKCWIAFSAKAKGTLVVDEGAKKALINDAKSLLGVGIIAVDGKFNQGDTVRIVDGLGREFAKGIVDYSSTELEGFAGKKNAREVIHRDQLVILK